MVGLFVCWSRILLTLILPFKCVLRQQSLLKGDNREHERPWRFGWGGQQQNGQRRWRKVDKIFKTKYKIEENLSLPIGLGPVTSGTRGLEQWQVSGMDGEAIFFTGRGGQGQKSIGQGGAGSPPSPQHGAGQGTPLFPRGRASIPGVHSLHGPALQMGSWCIASF